MNFSNYRHENEQEITKVFMERKSAHRKILEDIKKNNKFLKVSYLYSLKLTSCQFFQKNYFSTVKNLSKFIQSNFFKFIF